jgi:hypothetical protein
MIDKLPEASKAKIETIKDSLPLDKLGVFVEAELETSKPSGTNPPPAANPGGNDKKTFEPLTKTLDVLTGQGKDSAGLGAMERVEDPATGKWKFTYALPKMMDKLDRISLKPQGAQGPESDERKRW